MKKPRAGTSWFFVDESGDPTFYDHQGNLIVGQPGCSSILILGFVETQDPQPLRQAVLTIREEIIHAPYFQEIPSLRKTAVAFHAKDDLPEVRYQVFTTLQRHHLRFFAVVRNKHKLLDYVRQRNEHDPAYRYNPNELYDYLVRLLFKNLLHKDDEYNITFARRGKADRTAALRAALETARQRFAAQWKIISSAPMHVKPSTPPGCMGLQVVDYFLWALQRLYERREERYVEFLWPAFRLVHDLDDTRQAKYGVYYTQKKPLTTAALDLPEI